jgi:hypothetical protein
MKAAKELVAKTDGAKTKANAGVAATAAPLSVTSPATTSSKSTVVAANSNEQASFYAGLADAEKLLSSSIDTADKEKFAIYLSVMAASRKTGLSYVRTLPMSVMEQDFWEGKPSVDKISAALGCVILSRELKDMPEGIKALREMWMKNNGGYTNCFTAKKAGFSKVTDDATEAMDYAQKYYSKTTTRNFERCIESYIPVFCESAENASFQLIRAILSLAYETLAWITPEAVAEKVEKGVTFAKGALAILIVGIPSLVFGLALITKDSDQGIFFVFLRNLWGVIDWILLYIFATQEAYVTAVLTLFFAKGVHLAMERSAMSRDSMNEAKFEAVVKTVLYSAASDSNSALVSNIPPLTTKNSADSSVVSTLSNASAAASKRNIPPTSFARRPDKNKRGNSNSSRWSNGNPSAYRNSGLADNPGF